MEIFVLACHYTESNSLTGLRLFNLDDLTTMDVSIQSIKQVLASNKKVHVHDLYYNGNTLKLYNQSKYTKVVNGTVVGNKKLVIISESIMGQRFIVTFNGMNQFITEKTLLDYINNDRVSNAQVIKGKIQPIKDSFITKNQVDNLENVIKQLDKEVKQEVERVHNEERKAKLEQIRLKKEQIKNKQYKPEQNSDNNKNNNIIQSSVSKSLNRIHGTRVNTEVLKEAGNDGMTIDQKITTLILRLRQCRSLLYSTLYCIDRVVSIEVKRAAVTIDKLYMNPEFVKETSLEELLFILIHEIYHLLLRHKAREGNRIHDLWNIACDLYINKLITEDFDLPLNDIRAVKVKCNNNTLAYSIIRPADLVYSSTVDIDKDTPEILYAELVEIMNDDNQSGSGSGSGGNNSKGDSSQSGNSQSGNNNNDNKDKGNNQSNSNSGQDENNESDENDGLDNDELNGNNSSDNNSNNANKGKRRIIFRGTEINIDESSDDLIEDDNSANMSDDQKKNKSRSLVQRAQTIEKQMGSYGGHQSDFVERLVIADMAPKINWRSLLKNFLIAQSETYNSFSSPDRRFLSRKMVLPGPKLEEGGALENIKIAIDTSGSISDSDLGIALGQIKQLLMTYKAKAELLYWDTDIRAVYEFDDVDKLIKCKPAGGGGTDVNCVFERFEHRDYKIGKKVPPSLIIIFTDGVFPDVNSKYKKYKNTIWIINDGYGSFKAPFGKQASFIVET